MQYAYAEALGGNHSRPESMTYPGGAEVVFGYGSGVDDAISRLTTVADGANTVEVLLYLGLGMVAMRTHAETGVNLSYLKQSGEPDGDAGDPYTGLDRFGRIVDQRWINSSNTDLDRNQYGYDRAGNRLFKHNTVISDLSEQYAYDALGQLTDYQQGTPGDAVTRTQSWDLNPLGNWSTVTTDGVDQIRTHNAQNELTGIGEAASLTYDGNGNLTTDENEFQFRWDAWNRLVQVRDASDTVVATYGRDALGRRITVEQGETVTDRYFSSPWQLLEESIHGSTVTRHVWSPVYVDALVLRDRDTDGNGTLDERLYPLQDANWNVTALVTLAETVVERYSYDPYGQVTVRDGSGAVIAGSAKDWVFLHQGGEQIAAGDYDFRNRAYSPSLGRWLSNDPIGFEAGDNNWYRYEGSSPGNRVDPEGLADWWKCMDQCISDNDPLPFALEMAVRSIFALGGWQSKTAMAKIALILGNKDLHDRILSGIAMSNETRTNLISAIKLNIRGRGDAWVYIRKLGGSIAAAIGPAQIFYGLSLAAVETHCLGYCCAASWHNIQYNKNDADITQSLNDKFFGKSK